MTYNQGLLVRRKFGLPVVSYNLQLTNEYGELVELCSLRPIMIAPPRTLLRTYSGILPKWHAGILVELNET